MGMQIGLVAEKLPVGVLCPGVGHRLVRIIKVFCRCSSPVAKRTGKYGRPRPAPENSAKAGSDLALIINPISWMSGGFILIYSSKLKRKKSPDRVRNP